MFPLTVPSFAEYSGPRNEPPHCPGANVAVSVALSPAHISAGDACSVPDGARYGRTFIVTSAEPLSYSGAAAAKLILYGLGSRPVVPEFEGTALAGRLPVHRPRKSSVFGHFPGWSKCD